MYYWQAYVKGTGEIMERGTFPTVGRTLHDARSFIESYRWFDDPDELYTIRVKEGDLLP